MSAQEAVITPVTDAELQNPPPADWLMWRQRLIPAAGEPGDETWGDVPFEDRKHVGAWMVPSFLDVDRVGARLDVGGVDEQHIVPHQRVHEIPGWSTAKENRRTAPRPHAHVTGSRSRRA